MADPVFRESRDMILGADVYEKVVLDCRIKLQERLFLRETAFSWVASGVDSNTRTTFTFHDSGKWKQHQR